jgi:hypothetical protein
MRQIIVSVGYGNPVYVAGIDRLRSYLYLSKRLVAYTWPGAGWPPHHQAPYAFKYYAVCQAIRAHDAQQVIYLDSSVYPVGEEAIEEAFDLITKTGSMLHRNGWLVGQWSTDACLARYRLTRDDAMRIPDMVGGCWGLDLRTPPGRTWLDLMWAASNDPISFPGSWTNEKGQCSADPRCLGHRHDQTVGSIFAYQLGMPLLDHLWWHRGGQRVENARFICEPPKVEARP